MLLLKVHVLQYWIFSAVPVDYSNVHALDDFHLVMKALLLLDSITMTLFLNMASVLLPLEIIGFSYYLLRIFCWKNKKKWQQKYWESTAVLKNRSITENSNSQNLWRGATSAAEQQSAVVGTHLYALRTVLTHL